MRLLLITILSSLATSSSGRGDRKPCTATPFDLLVILDGSGSQVAVYDAHLGILLDLLGMVPIGDDATRVALVRYADSARVVFGFNSIRQDRHTIVDRVKNLEAEGGPTGTVAAIRTGLEELEREGRPGADRVVLLVNDGNSADHWTNVHATAQRLRQMNAQVFVITLNPETDNRELIMYAGSPDRVFGQQNLRDFLPAFSEFLREKCIEAEEFPHAPSPPPLRRRPTNPAFFLPGHHLQLALKVSNPTPPALQQQNCVNGLTDLVLLMDTSGSQEQVFREQQELAVRLVESLGGLGGSTRLAIIEFSSVAQQLTSLALHDTKEASISILKGIAHRGGPTGTVQALRAALSEFLYYGRPNAQQVIILFNDGHSQSTWEEVMETSRRLKDTEAEIFVVALAADRGPEIPYYSLDRQDRVYLSAQEDRLIRDVRETMNSERCLSPPPIILSNEDDDCDNDEVELYVVLDSSNSIREVFEAEKALAERLVSDVGPSVRTTLVHYSTTPTLVIRAESDARAVQQRIADLPHLAANTRTSDAVHMLLEELRIQRRSDTRRRRRRLAVLITDGQSQDAFSVVKSTARELHQEIQEVYVVSLSPEPDERELVEYAGASGYNRVFVRGREEQFLSAVQQRLCKREERRRKEEVLQIPSSLVTAGPPRPAFLLDPDCRAIHTDLILILDSRQPMLLPHGSLHDPFFFFIRKGYTTKIRSKAKLTPYRRTRSSSMEDVFYTHRNETYDLIASLPEPVFHQSQSMKIFDERLK